MDSFDYDLYFNYRIALKARKKGLSSKIPINNLENGYKEFYKRFADEAEKETGLLNKFGIKPIRADRLINRPEKKCRFQPLPQFLYIYGSLDIFMKIKEAAKGIFLTSSRYKLAKIYRPENRILKDFEGYCSNFDFICTGTGSEAEIEFIKTYSGNSLLIILPAYSLMDSGFMNQLKSSGVLNSKNILLLSALDPFSEISRYGFSLRNNLAFHLSKEIAILYLSKKSALSSVIKKFEAAGKSVKIFEREQIDICPYVEKPEENKIKTQKKYDYIQKFIINSLEKENITIDNLLKLSNIKFNITEREIFKAISILEMNFEIERCPGGIIKKL